MLSIKTAVQKNVDAAKKVEVTKAPAAVAKGAYTTKRVAERSVSAKPAAKRPAAKKPTTAKAAPTKTKRPTTGRGTYTEDQVIHLLVKENPKRADTMAARKFGCYREGITVGQYLDACVKLGLGKARHRFHSSLKYDVTHGYIKIGSAKAASAA